MNELPEPLNQFLQHPPAAPLPPALRAQVLQRTTRLLPRKRRWALAAAVAAGITLAFVTGYLLGSNQDGTPTPLPKPEPITQQPRPARRREPEPPAAVARFPSALELEWQAFDATDEKEQIRLYFRAGDLYLGQQQDLAAALRCYRQALSTYDARALEADPNDNWLVMALKRDQRKEN